jgi:uncharacterized protein YqeY
MTLKDRITEDMKAAMRARQAERLSAIRMLLAAIKQREVDDRVQADDALVTGVVEKLIKQRRDSVAQFEQAGRLDLATRERDEIDTLAAYLPAQADAAEIEAAVAAAIAESGAAGPQDMGKVMGLLKGRLAGRADLGAVSAAVRARLSRG